MIMKNMKFDLFIISQPLHLDPQPFQKLGKLEKVWETLFPLNYEFPVNDFLSISPRKFEWL